MIKTFVLSLFPLFFFGILSANSQPANDECSGAINILTNSETSDTYYTNTNATLSMPACAGSAGSDIWFKFTATAGRHQVISRAINDAAIIVQFFEGSCGSLTPLLCRDSGTWVTELTGLTPGKTYYYRIYLKSGSTAATNFSTYIRTPPMPANDEATGAINLTIGTELSSSTFYATQSAPACLASIYDAKDVWYKFVATATSHTLVLNPVSFDELMYQVYSGAPGSLTSLYCSPTSGYEQIKTNTLTGLTIGATYYIRVYNRYSDASPNITYKLSVTVGNAPANDECSGAINILTNSETSDTYYTNTNATLSMPACAGSAGSDIWFKFTATAGRHQVISRAINDAAIIVQFFEGSCGSLTPLLCRDSGTWVTELTGLTPGKTYYYRIYLKSGSTAATNFSTYIRTPPMPANDEATGAINLTIGTELSSSTFYATQSAPACLASIYDAKDVWYKFVATATSHTLVLNPVSFDELMYQVYSGAPGSLTSLYCSPTSGYEQIKTNTLTGLTIGATYYIRVYNRYSDASPNITYKLSVTVGNAPANDECSGAINILTNSETSDTYYTNTNATLSMPACAGSAGSDIWFKFTATAGRHQVISRAINDAAIIVQFFEGSCGSLTPLLCRDSGTWVTELTGLTPGKTYYYRIYLKSGSTAATNFSTYIRTPPMPANDEATGAINLTIGTELSSSTFYATQSAPACLASIYDAKDVWYKFVATATSHTLVLNPVSFDELMYQVYSGAPGSLTSLYCSPTSGYEQIKTNTLTGLTIGATYYIRVYNRYSDASPNITYKLSVSSSVLPVSLASFAAKVERNRIKLEWVTNNEKENSHFEVEKTLDGRRFVKLAKVPGRGKIETQSSYIVYDISPSNGTNLYVLKQVDLNGNIEILGSKVVSFGVFEEAEVSIFPNPSANNVNIRITDYKSKEAIVTLSNIVGQVFHREQITLKSVKGDYQLAFSKKPPAGTYVVTVMLSEKTLRLKLIIN